MTGQTIAALIHSLHSAELGGAGKQVDRADLLLQQAHGRKRMGMAERSERFERTRRDRGASAIAAIAL